MSTTSTSGRHLTMAHLAFPIRLGSRGLATVAQDSDADIIQSVALLLDTRPGERRSVPDYGVGDPVFAGLDPEEVLDVISEWEDRADVEQLSIDNLDGAGVAVSYNGTEVA